MAKPPAKTPAAKGKPKKPAKPPIDWVVVLKSDPDGVKKWNKLTRAQRSAADLDRADFAGADLAGINLVECAAKDFHAPAARLNSARLTHASFHKGDFRGTEFTGAGMEQFEGEQADFSGARFTGANLTGAILTRANLSTADLTRANLAGALLTGADLTGAVLTDANVLGTAFDQDTKWPAGFAVPGEARWVGRGTDPRFSGRGKKAVATDIHGLVARLDSVIDEKRMKRTRDMLKKGKNQLFSVVEPTMVRGIVRSQTEEELVYSCVLMEDGTYSCGTPDMAQCMGLWGEPCKHLLVLILGLSRAGQLDPAVADRWVVAAKTKNPRWNKTVKNHIADSLLRYKGAQAGDIDWRPTETIPEDFYAM